MNHRSLFDLEWQLRRDDSTIFCDLLSGPNLGMDYSQISSEQNNHNAGKTQNAYAVDPCNDHERHCFVDASSSHRGSTTFHNAEEEPRRALHLQNPPSCPTFLVAPRPNDSIEPPHMQSTSDTSWERVLRFDHNPLISQSESYCNGGSSNPGNRSSLSPLPESRPRTRTLIRRPLAPKAHMNASIGHGQREQASDTNSSFSPRIRSPQNTQEAALLSHRSQRRGKLSDDGRNKAAAVRRLGACLRCKMYKMGVSHLGGLFLFQCMYLTLTV